MPAWASAALLLCLGLREPAASRGAAPLHSSCMAAVTMHHCSPRAPLQSSWVAAITLHSCNLRAPLQSPCTAAILLHGCNHHAWLQSLWMAAITLHSCSAHAQLQSSCMAVLGWPWAGARGLITGAWPPVLRATPCLSHKAARRHPASPLGSGAAWGPLRLGLSRLWPAAVRHLASLHVHQQITEPSTVAHSPRKF